MDCLKNYIGIRGCDAPAYTWDANTDSDDDPETNPTSPSGLYINDLPGLSLKQIDKLANEEQITWYQLWDSVQDSTIKKFVNKVKAGYKELFGVCTIDDDWFCTNREALSTPLQYFLGIELMVVRLFTDRINRYTTIEINKARELRQEYSDSFVDELKSSLEIIDANTNQEGGDIFSIIETLP